MEIPGFVYDPVKNRYFKASTSKRPTQATTATVTADARRAKRTKRLDARVRLTALLRDREIRPVDPASFALHAWCMRVLRARSVHDPTLLSNIHDFELHPLGNSAAIACRNQLHFVRIASRKDDNGRRSMIVSEPKFTIGDTSAITSISVGTVAGTTVLASANLGDRNSGSMQIYRYDSDRDHVPALQYRFTPSKSSVWCGDLAPENSGSAISCGTRSGCAYVVKNWRSRPQVDKILLQARSDIMAQRFDGELLWNGCRNGSMEAVDRRNSQTVLSELVPTPSPISRIVKTTSCASDVFVTCMNGAVLMYDMRNTSRPSATLSTPIRDFFGNVNLASTPDGTMLLGSGGDRFTNLYNSRLGTLIGAKDFGSPIKKIQVCEAGMWVAGDSTFECWL